MIFYAPHPGLKGCPVQFPEHLRITAQWLEGQEMSVKEAIQCFEDAAPENERPISVEAKKGCIWVTMGSMVENDYPVHSWAAIFFRNRVIKGEIYERDVRGDHNWRIERRLVLDATDQCVLYQVLYDEPEGAYVEHDEISDQKQASMKEWLTWTKTARRIESDGREHEA